MILLYSLSSDRLLFFNVMYIFYSFYLVLARNVNKIIIFQI